MEADAEPETTCVTTDDGNYDGSDRVEHASNEGSNETNVSSDALRCYNSLTKLVLLSHNNNQ